MATYYSSTMSTTNQYIKYRIRLVTGTQSITGNYTPVTVSIQAWRTNTGFTTYGSGTAYCTIDGTQYSASISSGQRISYNSYTTLFTRSMNISHNSAGAKTLAMSAYISHSQFRSSSQSWNRTLPTIPRYAKINSFTITDITGIQFKINYSVDRATNAAQYRINSGSWITIPSNGIITGRSPGTSYNVQIRVRNSASNLWTNSTTRTVRTVRLSTYTVPNFNTGDSLTVSISRGSTNMYHDVTLQFWNDDQTFHDLEIITNVATSATFNLTESQLNQIYNGRVSHKTTSIRVKVVNKWGSGGTAQGTNYSSNSTATIVDAEPTLDGVSYLDTNTELQTILQDNQKILRAHAAGLMSNLRVVAGKATSQKGATLKNYKVSIGGNEYTVNTSSVEETGKIIDIGAVNQSSNQTAVLTVTDSRGYTASRSFTVQMINYVTPLILQASAERLNNYEESSYLRLEARRSIVKTNGDDLNYPEIQYRTKLPNVTEFGSWVNVNTQNTYVSGMYQNFDVDAYMGDFPNKQSRDVEVRIRDRFSSWLYRRGIVLPEGVALLRFLQDRIEAGVPLVDQETQGNYIFFSEYEEW